MGDLYVEATQAITDDAQMSADSFTWFRNDRSQIDAHRDGLTLDCQGLSDTMLVAAKILPAQSRKASDDFWVKSTREVHTATARAYGIVRVDDVDNPRNRLDGGRLLQHVHLAATAARLGLLGRHHRRPGRPEPARLPRGPPRARRAAQSTAGPGRRRT